MKRINAVLFIAGLALFGFLLRQFGLAKLLANVQRIGWHFFAVAALYVAVYALNNQVWRLILGEAKQRFGWFETFRHTVSAFCLNYMTPVVMLGGEAYRAYALTPTISADEATASVILFRFIHTLAHLLTWLAALAPALVLLPHTPGLMTAIAVAGVVIVGLLFLLFAGPSQGAIGKLFAALARVRFLGPVISRQREALDKINHLVVDFYRRRRPPARIFVDFYRPQFPVDSRTAPVGIGKNRQTGSCLVAAPVHVSILDTASFFFTIRLNLLQHPAAPID